MRRTKSSTSSSLNALASESIGIAWRTSANSRDGAAPTRWVGESVGRQFRMLSFERFEFAHQAGRSRRRASARRRARDSGSWPPRCARAVRRRGGPDRWRWIRSFSSNRTVLQDRWVCVSDWRCGGSLRSLAACRRRCGAGARCGRDDSRTRAMAKKNWAAFPHKDKAFDYAGDKLAKAWPKLHAGDQEPFPDEKHMSPPCSKANPKLGKDAGSHRRPAAGCLARFPSRRFPAGLRSRHRAEGARRIGGDQGRRHPCDLSGRRRSGQDRALRGSGPPRRRGTGRPARRSQQPLSARIRDGSPEPVHLDRQGAGPGSGRQGPRIAG